MNVLKNAQHHKPLGKCKSNPQGDATSQTLEKGIIFSMEKIARIDEYMEKLEPSH